LVLAFTSTSEDQPDTFLDGKSQRRRFSQDGILHVVTQQPLDCLALESGFSLLLQSFVIDKFPDLALRLQECLVGAVAEGDE
jgi:hypothetical protein